ncbi:MAG: hypothetical protein J0L66_18795 [Cytophagales bacterium]|nr:hypothetical protein [Cytophagales bacterium]
MKRLNEIFVVSYMYRILFILIFTACMNAQPNLSYSDGSANRYLISPTQVRYIPVKPEESSTGFYSGGEPATAAITAQQFAEIKELFEHAMAQADQQMADRIKTSGLLEIEGKQVILKPEAPLKARIESHLNKLLGR